MGNFRFAMLFLFYGICLEDGEFFACTKTTMWRYLTWCLYSLYECISLVAYASNCWLVILVFMDALFTCASLDFVQDLIRMHIKWLLYLIASYYEYMIQQFHTCLGLNIIMK